MKKRTTGASIALMVLAMSIGLVGNASATALTGQAYQGSAYGTYATVGSLVKSGMSSPISLPCAPQAPPGFGPIHSTTAAVNAPNLLTTGVIDNSVSTGPASGPPVSKSTSDITDASLLSGLVSASTIHAVSTTSRDSAGYHVSGAGSSFVGLTVAGVPIVGLPAKNTTLPLPGVGKVVLNEQTSRITATSARLTVNMIDITVTTALPGVPAGTRIIVGHAVSGLTQQSASAPTLRGSASGAYAHIGTVITAGQEFPVSFCGSTNGKTVTNSAVSANLPGVLSSGTVTNTVNGTIGATTSTSKSAAKVQNLNLLSGLVTADVIRADANASITGATVSLDETGTTFTNLVVNGNPIAADTAPNTKITVGGITVWLNRVIQTTNGITVRAIEITVSGANPYSLPVRSDIQVADAFAAAYPHPTS